MPIDYKRVVAIRGWARGRSGYYINDSPWRAYTVIQFEGDDTKYFYPLESCVESADDFEDYVHLVRTESREVAEP